mmetsp:Transcript_13484/g.34579  ORF Transcript_13484/g.34579 Transcript_13484/m.34579 type:complete len:254 (-) Transcript_13484:568-1329(-)
MRLDARTSACCGFVHGACAASKHLADLLGSPSISSDLLGSPQVSPDLLISPHISSDLLRPPQTSSDLLKPPQPSSSLADKGVQRQDNGRQPAALLGLRRGGNLAGVEAPAKLDEIPLLLRHGPGLVHLVTIDTQPLAAVDGVIHDALLERRLPCDTKLFGKVLLLGRGRVELCRLAEGRLVGNRVIVVVDVLVLLDDVSSQRALGGDREASLGELGRDELLGGLRHRVRLDEHEGLHLAVRPLARHPCDCLGL